MASRYYYLFTVFACLIIAFTSFFASYLVFGQKKLLIGYLLFFLVLMELILIISSLNSINKKIASFFNSVHNEDTSIQLPKSAGSSVVREIYRGMNRAIEVFQSVKMESEAREKLFLAMIEHSTTGFISIDEYGDFEIMNQMARKLLGVEYTSNLERIKSELPELYKVIINLKPGQSKSCRINLPDFSTIVQLSSSVLIYKNKRLTLVSILDIQKEIDARELESWQKLIRIMNHEIMNSIAPITSASKTLMKIFNNSDQPIKKEDITDKIIADTKSGLDVIETMSSGLTYFVENYRRLSKIPEPEINEINIKKWGATLSQILQECVVRETLLDISIHESLKSFWGDERLLNQVLINLVKNASDAPIENKSKQIKISFEPSIKGQLNITVWNNGEAIDKENLDKIFIPFFTTKGDGAGIGLYVSRQIINLHNGSLTVISNNETGTLFQISI